MSSPGSGAHALKRVRKLRRRQVKRFGKRALRGLDDFFGQHSLVGDPVVFDAGQFPFTRSLEARWRSIRAEYQRLQEGGAVLPRVQTIHKGSRNVGQGERWRIFLFYGFGYRSDRNCGECPETARVLDAIPNLQNAWFSILEPGCQIPPHRGVTKGLIRTHLPLVVPREREKCLMAIEGHEVRWQEGRCLVFDDMREHRVANDSDEARVVLLLDTLRPLSRTATVLNHGLLAAARRTAYVRDAYEREDRWEQEFYASRDGR